MDVASVAAGISEAQLGTVQGAAGVAVLKKAMDIQQQAAMQLLEALPQIPAVAPGQPGGVINTFA